MSNSVFTNNLRLEEIASGERSGTWGTATNTNISLITDAFAFGTENITTNATAHSTNMEDADETQTGAPRSMYLKYTGTLNATCTVTLGPNSVSKVWIIENATSGSQILTIKQGNGSSVNIPNGSVKVVYSDGGGTGANVVDAFTDLDVAGTFAVAGNTTVGGTFTSTGAVTANAGVSIDNITIDGTEIDLSSGDLTLDVAGDIVLNSDDGIIFLKDDSATFGSLNNNSGNLIIKSGTTTAATFSGANVTLAGTVVTGGLTTLGGNLVIPNAGNIGSVGDTDAISISSSGVVTLTQNLIIPDGGNIGSANDTDAIAISSGGVVTMNQIPVFSAGINVSGGSIAGSLSSTTQGNITATGALNSGSITSGFGAINNGSSNISTTGTISFGSLTDGTTTITSIDQDISSVSSSHDTLATAKAIKTYVDNQTVTATGIVGTGTGNTALGSTALDSITSGAEYNTAVGLNAGTNLSASDKNTFVGAEAGENVTSNSQQNIAIGYQALKGVSSASVDFNVAIGNETMDIIGSGYSNVSVGYKAGNQIRDSHNNTFIGTQSGRGGYNTDVSGNYNTGVGSSAAGNISTGSNNTIIGSQAANNMTTGSNNVAIGYGAGNAQPGTIQTNLEGGDNNILIGYLADVSSYTTDNEIVLGNSSHDSLRCNDTSISTLSDERDKTDIVDNPFGLDFINSIRPVQFKWDRRKLRVGDETAIYNGRTKLGFIAQEFQKAMPNEENKIIDLVNEKNPERLETKMSNLIPVLTKAIQQLSDKNDALEDRIKLLEG